VDSAELKERVRELRAEGRSPKEIARALKVPPSVVAPLVRALAAESSGDDREAELIGCWMSVGWSNGLGVDPSRGWVDEAPDADGGMVSVLVVRRETWDRLAVAGFLADVYCTGIKHIIGPDSLNEREMLRFREFFFSDYKGYQEVPLDLARHLVFGADAYGQSVGIDSHEEFERVSPILGDPWEGPSAITFGREGRPYYVPGAYDDPQKVIHLLRRKLSYDEFDYEV